MTFRPLFLFSVALLCGWDASRGESLGSNPFELLDGDRVVLLGNTLLEREKEGGYIETALTARYPGRRIQFRNMSWPGDTVDVQLRPLNFGDLKVHLENYRPTVAFLSYGLNEAFEGPGKLESFVEGYGRILDILAELEVRKVVLIGPNPHEPKEAPLPDPAEHNKHLAAFNESIGKLASDRGHLFIDLFEALGRGERQKIPFAENGIHLNDYGYRLAAREIDRELHGNLEPWSIEIEAGEGAVEEPTGAKVEKLESAPSSVSFVALSASLPPLPLGEVETPGGGIQIDKAIQDDRRLSIRRLGPGNYELAIDGEEVATGDAEDWEAGMNWTSGPEYNHLEELRHAIVRKNQYFFYRWRAHNGEYIYGRRAKSSGDGYGQGNSGNEQFPAEMAEFERLIAEEEGRIFELATPPQVRYELRRVEGVQ